MNVVYVKYNAYVAPLHRAIHQGEHWPADDPVVRAMPEAFSTDPRYGVQWSGEPPPELAEPPVEQVTAGPGEKRAAVRRG